jgi:hypothetical protein
MTLLLQNNPMNPPSASTANYCWHTPMKAKESDESRCGQPNAKPVCSGIWKQGVLREEYCEVQDNPNDCCGDSCENCR